LDEIGAQTSKRLQPGFTDGISLQPMMTSFRFTRAHENSGQFIQHKKFTFSEPVFDGQLKWIKEFDLPGNNDWVDELIESDNGLVIMARKPHCTQ
jgi:hypothetical protein